MLVYILKSVACLAILFLFYKVFLEKENMHVFKRFYLLGSLVLSFGIPAIVFTEYVEAAPSSEIEAAVLQQTTNVNNVIHIPRALESEVVNIAPLLWTVYFIGLFFFGLNFLKNLFQILLRIQRNPKHRLNRFTRVLLKEKISPHTFFSYIFLNKTKLESNEIPKEVLLHEETHARQKHSYDVLFVELLQLLFWVNPLVYFFNRAIKLNHEFLADQAVLKKDINKVTYQNTLLSYLSADSEKKYQPQLANAINYSSIKKRFTVMKTHTSKKAIYLRTLLLLPLMAILLYGFSDTKVIETAPNLIDQASQEVVHNQITPPENIQNNINQKGATREEVYQFNTLAKKYNKQPKASRIVPAKDLRVLEDVYGKMSERQKANAQPFPEFPQMDKPLQDGASRELMAEYDKLAKHYNEMPRTEMKIKKKDVDRLGHIYSLMSEKQKADAAPFPDFPPMPASPKAPKAPKAVKAPKVKKGEKNDIPPPQPPQPNLNNEEFAEKVIDDIIANQDPYDNLNKFYSKVPEGRIDKFTSLPLPPLAQRIKKRVYVNFPPTLPPEPQTPLDHIIEMAKMGATFYYEGNEIFSDKAIELVKNNKNLNIHSSGHKNEHPEVRISKNPISNEK